MVYGLYRALIPLLPWDRIKFTMVPEFNGEVCEIDLEFFVSTARSWYAECGEDRKTPFSPESNENDEKERRRGRMKAAIRFSDPVDCGERTIVPVI